MSKQEDTTEDMAMEYEVMPGADRPEEDDAQQLDLSFGEVEEELAQESVEEELAQESVEEGEEEVVAEVEEGQDDTEDEGVAE